MPAILLPSLYRLSISFRQVFRSKGRIFNLLSSIEAPRLVDFSYHIHKGYIGISGTVEDQGAKLSALSHFLDSPRRNGTLSSVSIMFPAKDMVSDAGLAFLAQGLTGVQSLCLYFDAQSYSVLLQSNLPNLTSLYLVMTPSAVEKVQETLGTARSFLQRQSRRIELSLDVGLDDFPRSDREAARTWLQEAGFHLGKRKGIYTVRWTPNCFKRVLIELARLYIGPACKHRRL